MTQIWIRKKVRVPTLINITPILEALLLLIAAVITSFVIPWIKKKTTAAQQAELESWVTVAVTAAEQLFRGTGRGGEKKAYVLQFLESKGYVVDLDSIDALIESAVFNLTANQKGV